MKLTHVVVGAVLLVVVAQCGGDSDVVAGARDASVEPSRPSPSASPSAGRKADDGTAVAALSLLPVKGRAPMTGYDRDRFGPAWLDADRNGCDTRNDVLRERLFPVTLESNGCVVAAGSYDDPYTGSTIDYWQGHVSLIDIDHIVSLGNAWATGAFGWPIKKRAAFANDPLNLLPTDAGANRQKGDGDAATWLPANKPYRCEYVSRQVAVKAKYDLWVTSAEQAAIQRVLTPCDGQALTPDPWGAPTAVDHNISDPFDATNDAATDSSAEPATYDSCDEARAAGATPVRIGDLGYGTHLDGDGDGTGCE
nr:DUF1524 domain-containing protein [Nocardioides lacusdianchii]